MWIKINLSKLKDGDNFDIFSPSYGRLTNYVFRKDFANEKGNSFFESAASGQTCVRDATHFMYIPENPTN